MLNMIDCIEQALTQYCGTIAIMLQEMKSHTLRRLRADTRQSSQSLHHALQSILSLIR
jgi:hypothetical protein